RSLHEAERFRGICQHPACSICQLLARAKQQVNGTDHQPKKDPRRVVSSSSVPNLPSPPLTSNPGQARVPAHHPTPPHSTMDGADSGAGGGSAAATAAKWRSDASRAFQYYLDRSTPHSTGRWLGTLGVAAIYALRVYLVEGFYIVTYGLGIYLLNLLIGFLSPMVDPELDPSAAADGPALPTRGSDEFKPFIRRLPEFKFWYAITKAFVVAFVMTFFSVFDVPVFWPILLCYWIVLFVLTMKRQIVHMIKYKYVPFNIGKQKYGGKKSGASSSSSKD
ncbi:hypothetical protein EJB05_32009, partial [Eragrostis curvula]